MMSAVFFYMSPTCSFNGCSLAVPALEFKSKCKQKRLTKVSLLFGGEGPQPNQGAKFNPTIHYVPYEIVMERTKEYLEK